MADDILSKYGYDDEPKKQGIPTFTEYAGGSGNLTPAEWNQARQSYLSEYLPQLVDARAGKKPARGVTEWNDRRAQIEQDITEDFGRQVPPRKTDGFFDKVENQARALAGGVVGFGESLTNVLPGGPGAVGEYLGGVSENLRKGMSETEKIEAQRAAGIKKAGDEVGGLTSIWANVAEIRGTDVSGAVGSTLPTIATGGLTSLTARGLAAVGGTRALAGTRAGAALQTAGAALPKTTMGAVGGAAGLGEQRKGRYDQVKQEAEDQGYSPEEADALARKATELPLWETVAAIGLGTAGAVTGVERAFIPGTKIPLSTGTSRLAKTKTVGSGAGAEGLQEFGQGGVGAYGANTAAVDFGLADEGSEGKGVLGQATAGAVIGTGMGTLSGSYEAATDKTKFLGDVAKTIPETQTLAPARVKQIGKIVQEYAKRGELEKLADLGAAPGDQGLAGKMAAKLLNRKAAQPKAEAEFKPDAEQEDLLKKAAQFDDTDTTEQGGEAGVSADGEPIARFGTYIPSETGSQPNTEAPLRLAQILDREVGDAPISIAAAESLATEHEKGYSQWAATDKTPGAVRREPKGFIEGTIDNILATAYLQGMDMDPEAEARGKARAEQFMGEKDEIEASSRQEIGDRTKEDGTLATETEFQANSPQDNLVPVREGEKPAGQVLEAGGEFDPAGWTESENKINRKTGKPNYPDGVKLYKKSEPDGIRRVITRDGKVSKDITVTGPIELQNSSLNFDGAATGKLEINNLTGDLVFTSDEGGVFKMSPKASADYKKGVPIADIVSEEFTDSGKDVNGKQIPKTTTAKVMPAKMAPADDKPAVFRSNRPPADRSKIPTLTQEIPTLTEVVDTKTQPKFGNIPTLTEVVEPGQPKPTKGATDDTPPADTRNANRKEQEAKAAEEVKADVPETDFGNTETAQKTGSSKDVDAEFNKEWQAPFDKAKAKGDKDAIQSIYNKVKVALNGVAQSRGKDVVAKFEGLKTEIEEYSEALKNARETVDTSKDQKIGVDSRGRDVFEGTDGSLKGVRYTFDERGRINTGATVEESADLPKKEAKSDTSEKRVPKTQENEQVDTAQKTGTDAKASQPKAAKKRPDPAKSLRMAAYKKNPLMTLLASKGLFHDKTKPNSMKAEFSPDRQVMVSGYPPVFRRTGLQLDKMLSLAIEDGYLPPGSTESELYDLIARAIGGEKISPLYGEDGLDTIEAQMEAQKAAEYEEYLASQQENPADPKDVFSDDEVDFVNELDQETQQVKDEVYALIAMAEAEGINGQTILNDLMFEGTFASPPVSSKEIYNAAKAAIEDALRTGKGTGSEATGQPGTEAGQEKGTKKVGNEFQSALDREYNNGFETGNKAVVRSKQDLESDYGPLTDAQVADLRKAYSDGANESDAAETGAQAGESSELDQKLNPGVPKGFYNLTWRQAIDKIFEEHGKKVRVSDGTIFYPTEIAGAENGIGGLKGDALAYANQKINAIKAGNIRTGKDWWDELDPIEGLTAPTPDDIRAQETAKEKAAAKKKADDAAAAEEERKKREQADIKKASEAAADTFELGGDAMTNLTGQKDIFGGVTEEELAPVERSIEDMRRELVNLEDRIVGAAGLAPGFIEEAMKSRKVPAQLKQQRNDLREKLREERARVSNTPKAEPAPAPAPNPREVAEAANREALKNFKKGDEVEFVNPNGAVTRATIDWIMDAEIGLVNLKDEAGRVITAPARFLRKAGVAPTQDTDIKSVRDLADKMGMDYVGGVFTDSLKKGQSFTLLGKAYTVTAVTDTRVRIKSEDGKTIEALKYGDKLVSGGSRDKQPYDQFARDLEGQISVDLINENNPFHKNSEVFNLTQAAIDALPGGPKAPTTEKKLPTAPAVRRQMEKKAAEAKKSEPKPAPVVNPNTIFTEDAAERARARLKSKLGRLNSGIDPESMMDGITLAGYHIEKGARTFAAYARAMIEDLGEGVRPYLKSWYMGVKYDPRATSFDGMDNAASVESADIDALMAQESEDATNTNADLEPDSQGTAAESAVVDPVPGDTGNAARSSGQAGGRAGRGGGSRQQDGAGNATGGATSDGERGDQRVYPGGTEPELADILTGSEFAERGGDSGITGVPPESIATSKVNRTAESEAQSAKRVEAQSNAPGVVKLGDLENIRATLPALLPGQQEDVKKAEDRFAKPDGYGMLFTNGTGTGKTFTGLGIVKRFALQGKTNTLIVVPDEKIGDDWIESGAILGLNITRLEGTKDKGKGVTITTYANLGENNELAKRQWDLVVADEAHTLMQSADGMVTGYLSATRAITMHPDGVGARHSMLAADELARMSELVEEIRSLNLTLGKPDSTDMARDAASKRLPIAKKELDAVSIESEKIREAVKADVAASQGAGRTRLTALSATPFAYVKTIDWANGYLFDYNEGQPREEGTSRGYNEGTNRERFFMRNFGYSMRYNKLTAPGAQVNSEVMERQFNTMLKNSGALSGRMLDVPADYDRRFVLVDSAIGTRIDEALSWLDDQVKSNSENKYRYRNFRDLVRDEFDYLKQRFLLEALKAKESIPIVRKHLEMGRKVVVFHDYKKGGMKGNPFSPRIADSELLAVKAEFRDKFPDLVSGDIGQLDAPIEVFKREFPDVLLVNGDEKKSDLLSRYKRFQDDGTGPLVMLVQSAKNKGWSGHDTTGVNQRVLINLGLPTAPTLVIQQEGRVYRTGQVTDAIQRYLNTGTSWERAAFASTIASRASTAENLGMGEQARGLKDSFIMAFEESDAYPPGHEGEGKGGKALDAAQASALTEFDRAKTLYYAQQKKTSKNKSQEGADYFATPEPVGLKMVEWLDTGPEGDYLEPSAGHGAIARWLPTNTNRTVIEPSNILRSRLMLVMNPSEDRILDGTFEELHIGNKFHGIVLNPPFGVGGKTAMEHLAKAYGHLRPGGRIVALIPTGPAADKRFDAWYYGQDEKGRPTVPDIQMVAEIKLPTQTFERAGTGVMTRIVVLEKAFDPKDVQTIVTRKIDLTGVGSANELFNKIEALELPKRAAPAQQAQPAQQATPKKAAKAAQESTSYTVDQDGREFITYTTKAGKQLRGIIVKAASKAEAQKLDAWTWKMGDGYFVREKHVRPDGDKDAGGDGKAAFSRGAPTGSMATDRAQAEVDALTSQWANAPDVVVVANMQDPKVPKAVRDYDARQKSLGAKGEVEGFFYGGKVYIVAGSLRGKGDVARVLFHETLGHYGLRGAFGDALGGVLRQIVGSRRAEVAAKAKQYGLDMNKPAQALTAAEEVLAEMAQTKPELSFVKRAIAAIRTWLRANVPGLSDLSVTDAEIIRNFILPARRFVESGPGRGDRGGMPAFQRSAGDTQPAPPTDVNPMGFYSELARQMGRGPNQAAADQWKSFMKGLQGKGVKAEEIEWTGINEWLDLQQGKIPKSAVMEYLRGNGVQVEQVTLGNDVSNLPDIPDNWDVNWNSDDGYVVTDEDGEVRGTGATEFDARVEAMENEDDFIGDSRAVKYEKYTIPGGQNYREVLLTLPEKTGEYDRLEGLAFEAAQRGDKDEFKRLKAQAEKVKPGQPYRSSHWDQPNVIAHLRLNDRTDADGKRVLFVEEIQSDWGQEGKKKGFKGEPPTLKIGAVKNGYVEVVDQDGKFVTNITEYQVPGLAEADVLAEAQRRLDQEPERTADTLRVPTAPFVTKTDSWLGLALKRVAQMAVEGGYDKVAFVNGQQSADRYDLSKQVDSITYEPTDKGYSINVLAGGRNIKQGDFTREELVDIVGKEIVQKMDANEGKQAFDPAVEPDLASTRVLSGDGLKVGGEGMKAFYDKIVPNAVNAMLKKVGGGKVSRVDAGNGTEAKRIQLRAKIRNLPFESKERAALTDELYAIGMEYTPLEQSGFEVTDNMRDTVNAGLPMFSRQNMNLSQMEEMARTGKKPVESKTRQEWIQDKEDYMATRWADSTRPHDVWARTQDPELGAALVVDKNLAPGRIADFEKRMMNEHGNKIANEIGKIAKKYKLSYEVAKESAGNWMTAVYAPLANAHLRQKDQKALSESIIEAEEVKAEIKDYEQLQKDVSNAIAGGNVTRTQLDALIAQSRNVSRAEMKLRRLQSTQPQNAEALREREIRTAYLEFMIQQEEEAFKAMRNDLATSDNTAVTRKLMQKIAVDTAKLKKELGVKSAEVTRNRNAMVKRAKAIAGPVQDPSEMPLDAGVAGGYTDATAAYLQNAFEQNIDKADLEALAELVYDLNAWKLDQDLQSGRVTKDMVAQWPKYRQYVPLTGDPRSEQSEGADMFATGSVNQSKDKALMGRSGSLAQNGIDASFEQVDKAAKYHGWEPYKQTLHDWYSEQLQEKMDGGLNELQAAAQIREESGISRARESIQRPSDNTIIYRKGKESWVYDLGSEEAVAALKSSYKEPLSSTMKLLGFGTRYLARSVTQFLPGLGPVNFVRDVWTKSENIRTREQELGFDMNQVGRDLIKFAASKDAASAIGRALAVDTPVDWLLKADKNDPMQAEFAEFLAAGGASTWGAYVAGDAEGLTQKLSEAVTIANAPGAWMKTKSAGSAVVKALEVWNGTFELQTTFAAYRALKQNGMDAKKAAEVSLELMNFRKSGTMMNNIRALYMFANPIALDAQQVYKTLKTPRGQKRFAAYLAIGMVLYAMLRAGEDDEETGKNLMDEESDFVMERNIPIRIPGTDLKFKVPVGFGLPQLAWGTAVHLNKFLLGDRTAGETVGNIAKVWVKTAAPVAPSETSPTKDFTTWLIQTVTPTNLKPLVNVALNKNFAGGTLNPREDTQDKPDALMGKRNTPEWYKDLAKDAATIFGWDMTPEAWKEIIQGYTIGPIREVIKGTIDNPQREKTQEILGEAGRKTSAVVSPFVDRFVFSTTDDELRQRMYYRVRDQLSEVAKKEQLGEELGPKEQQMLKLHGEVKKMEGSARSILAQATKSKSEIRKERAKVLYAKEMIKIESKVLQRMNTMKGLE